VLVDRGQDVGVTVGQHQGRAPRELGPGGAPENEVAGQEPDGALWARHHRSPSRRWQEGREKQVFSPRTNRRARPAGAGPPTELGTGPARGPRRQPAGADDIAAPPLPGTGGPDGGRPCARRMGAIAMLWIRGTLPGSRPRGRVRLGHTVHARERVWRRRGRGGAAGVGAATSAATFTGGCGATVGTWPRVGRTWPRTQRKSWLLGATAALPHETPPPSARVRAAHAPSVPAARWWSGTSGRGAITAPAPASGAS
jgi:hypothetical protein